ncbi:hypothetical protein DBT_1337 [Dissulfuribacter thermophilus]|uniref:Uncharacterized protein n=1 Tax=Dissulfuribacter thermophilus TaxID=1156395 RepID=A0A1B9F5U9_9BACT|nr:TorF family putative porin [Dissulfuribacter thermophilus]OCC15214.1 hypothetical protein DBT_1337 [Dissulfuribacter thermophilus]
MKNCKKINILVLCMMICATVFTPRFVRADEAKPSVDASLTLTSQYIWRGYELSKDSLVVQPYFGLSYEGFGASIWQNIDTNPYDTSLENLNETDFTLSYDTEINGVSVGAGWIWYALPGSDDSHEVYVTAGLNTFLNPTLTIYREFAHAPSTYITLGISHSIALPWRNASLDMGLQGSYLISNDSGVYADPNDPSDEYSNFHDGLASISLNIPVAEYISVSPELYWSFPLCQDAADDMQAGNANHGGKDNFVYGGITVNLSF